MNPSGDGFRGSSTFIPPDTLMPRSMNILMFLLAVHAAASCAMANDESSSGAATSLPNGNIAGITWSASLTYDFSVGLRGGIDDTASASRHWFDANLTFDLETLLGAKGATLFVDFQNQDGEVGSERITGDFQFFSNIDNESFTQLSEVWYEQVFDDSPWRLKIGKVDANIEFAYTEWGAWHLNSSDAFSPTIVGFPTWPDPATSVNVFFEGDEFVAKFGVYDGALQEGVPTGQRGPKTFLGAPADLFLIGEFGPMWSVGADELPGRLAVGVWHHTGTFERFDGGEEDGTTGLYVIAEQSLFRRDSSELESQGDIGMFLQYGYADPALSDAEHYIGGGITFNGPIAGRENDVLGFGANAVLFTDEPAAGYDDSFELALEAFYAVQLGDHLVIQPDVQYIANPSGDASIDDAWVFTLRAIVEF